MLRRVFATPYADVAALERAVTATDLNWTVAHLNGLTNRPAAGAVDASPGLLAHPRCARAEVAIALLDTVADLALARTAVNVGGAG